MLTNVEHEQNVFVESLVSASYEMQEKDVKPYSFTIPETTFKHFKKTIMYKGMFENASDWQKRLWNSKKNPLNFDKPMFMGLFVDVVPDKKEAKDICFLNAGSNYSEMKIPFNYSLDLVRKYMMKNNLVIIIKSRADIFHNVSKNEWQAAELLREMITEVEFRRYMVHGFIMVQGKSEKRYQIFRKNKHLRVWYNNEMIEELCISFADKNIPLTDKVVAFKFMIETDEDEFRKQANIYKFKKVA